ncbi:antitoxin [Leptospira adleri]|uniref:Antitoxin n=1 Tax=Leptospira adleri TaxID=2023186 RepID=A0A2M9YUW6_9LEPT|nr:antitoxin [Leptospira adleri]PJZ55315.1 antitoxin [Leptospira adleri]PJZ59761.1 antitoxin [Leptospira adleri]
MKTTLEIPDILYKQAKIKAAERGVSMRVLIITALEHNLKMEEEHSKIKASEKFESNRYGWPVLPKKKGIKVTNELINQLKEEEV